MQAENSNPVVLCFGGLDPSGGAGLQADIEAIAACGGHALPIATCLTVQNSAQAFKFSPTESQLIAQQAESLLQDININGCKIGVIPNGEIATVISGIIRQIPNIPVVLDPVFRASRGSTFCDQATINTISEMLLPLTSIATPNVAELVALTSESEPLTARATELCMLGSDYVLVTDADNPAQKVCNKLFNAQGLIKEYYWPKLPHAYHGSGCTLSSALACFLSMKTEVSIATNLAQEYTWHSLQNAQALGTGQRIPKRINVHAD